MFDEKINKDIFKMYLSTRETRNMLAFQIVNDIAKKEKQKQDMINAANSSIRKNPEGPTTLPAMGAFEVSIAKPQNGLTKIEITGNVSSPASTLLRRATSIGLGYGIGRMAYNGQTVSADEGAESSWLETSGIVVLSAIGSVLSEQYIFTNIAGNPIEPTTIVIPAKEPGETMQQYQERLDRWDIEDNLPEASKAKAKKLFENIKQVVVVDRGLAFAEAFATFYHGYKRHDSILMGLGWALTGNLGLALAQGYAKKQPV